MERPGICLGCFREWKEGNAVCPSCGWEPQKAYGEINGWTTGHVLEKRYLLGFPWLRTEGWAVWRVYDCLLRISCFLLCAEGETQEPPSGMAERLQKFGALTGAGIQLLSVRKLEEKDVLLFSMRDAEGKEEAMQAVLRAKEREEESPPDFDNLLAADRKKEQALLPGTWLSGRYRILECVGVGGFGILYCCEDAALHRLTAVKEYFPAEWAEREDTYVTVKESRLVEAYRFGMQSFYREARMQAKFLHTPHVAAVYDALEENDTVYLVMEYISGISIGREMRAREYQAYSPEEAGEILLPVMEVLGALHEERIIHSDVSPGNIMRSEEEEIFLIDLGAAKYALDSQPVLSAAFLKPDYAAPEQYRTAREGIPKEEGPWTDVYALGATLYYLLTGQKPPGVIQRLGGTHMEVTLSPKCRLKRKREWEKLLNRAMALDVRERIQTAGELEKEMRMLLEGKKNRKERKGERK